MADHEHEEANRAVHAGGDRPTRKDERDAGEAPARGVMSSQVDANRANAFDAGAARDTAAVEAARRRAVIQSANRAGEMADTIRDKIVPQLLSLSSSGYSAGAPDALAPDIVQAVAEAAVAGELGVVQSHLHAHTLRGGTIADALIALIGGAAAKLGEDWEHDTRDFMDVTIGLGTLQAAILSVSEPYADERNVARSVILGPSPGEDHTLGLAIVNHFFRQSDWSVAFMPYASEQELTAEVASRWFAVAGLSVASEPLVKRASHTVAALRRHSKNENLKIMVGGPLARIDPSLAERVGADTAVSDGRRAVVWAERWVEAGLDAGSATSG
ncbi:MAG: cobalamin B12-binding domain-containing protein [Pseudomonadota bacterium]